MYRTKKPEQEKHEHNWQKTDWNESHCDCGRVLVSQAEYDRRVSEWTDYKVAIRQTEAYRLFSEARGLFRSAQSGNQADLAKLKEVSARARQLLKDRGYTKTEDGWELAPGLKETGEVARPKGLNPFGSGRYVILQ